MIRRLFALQLAGPDVSGASLRRKGASGEVLSRPRIFLGCCEGEYGLVWVGVLEI